MEGHLTKVLFALRKGKTAIIVENSIILLAFAFPTQKENRGPGQINRPQNASPLSHADSISDEEYLYPVKTNAKRRLYTRVKVLGHSFNVMVDTGASINVIDKETFAKLPEIQLGQRKTRTFAYDNDKPVRFIDKFDAVLETRKQYTVATFYVVNNNTSGNLINADTAQELGLVTLHLNKTSSPSTLATQMTNDQKLMEILERHSSVFNGLGKLKDYTVKLNISEDVIPVAEPQRHITFHIREKVRRAIEILEKDGIIERVPGTQATAWISPIVAVPKKRDDVLICVDMRKPNHAQQLKLRKFDQTMTGFTLHQMGSPKETTSSPSPSVHHHQVVKRKVILQ